MVLRAPCVALGGSFVGLRESCFGLGGYYACLRWPCLALDDSVLTWKGPVLTWPGAVLAWKGPLSVWKGPLPSKGKKGKCNGQCIGVTFFPLDGPCVASAEPYIVLRGSLLTWEGPLLAWESKALWEGLYGLRMLGLGWRRPCDVGDPCVGLGDPCVGLREPCGVLA